MQVADDEEALRERARDHVLKKDPVYAKDGKEALQELRELSKNHMELAGKICMDRRNQIVGRMICAVLNPLKDRDRPEAQSLKPWTGLVPHSGSKSGRGDFPRLAGKLECVSGPPAPHVGRISYLR